MFMCITLLDQLAVSMNGELWLHWGQFVFISLRVHCGCVVQPHLLHTRTLHLVGESQFFIKTETAAIATVEICSSVKERGRRERKEAYSYFLIAFQYSRVHWKTFIVFELNQSLSGIRNLRSQKYELLTFRRGSEYFGVADLRKFQVSRKGWQKTAQTLTLDHQPCVF